MNAVTSTDPEPVEISNVCSFCEYDAVSRYRETLFCRHHLIWFYLGLAMDWKD
jgi:hypothetical protein